MLGERTTRAGKRKLEAVAILNRAVRKAPLSRSPREAKVHAMWVSGGQAKQRLEVVK